MLPREQALKEYVDENFVNTTATHKTDPEKIKVVDVMATIRKCQADNFSQITKKGDDGTLHLKYYCSKKTFNKAEHKIIVVQQSQKLTVRYEISINYSTRIGLKLFIDLGKRMKLRRQRVKDFDKDRLLKPEQMVGFNEVDGETSYMVLAANFKKNSAAAQENNQATTQENIQTNLSQNHAGNQSINLQPSINGTTFNYLECFNYPVSLNNVQLHELKNKYILYLLDINNLRIMTKLLLRSGQFQRIPLLEEKSNISDELDYLKFHIPDEEKVGILNRLLPKNLPMDQGDKRQLENLRTGYIITIGNVPIPLVTQCYNTMSQRLQQKQNYYSLSECSKQLLLELIKENKKIELRYINSKLNIADGFTKYLIRLEGETVKYIRWWSIVNHFYDIRFLCAKGVLDGSYFELWKMEPFKKGLKINSCKGRANTFFINGTTDNALEADAKNQMMNQEVFLSEKNTKLRMFLETLDSGTTYHMTDNANILTNIVKSMGTYKGYINGNIIILKHALYSQVFKKNSISVDGRNYSVTLNVNNNFLKGTDFS
ncbi:hypothetical protein H8356DRAFT_1338563 [Neocallimastix lanati (nom. inval.)]|nr:hypothetical protein H8356DRAFT_1338563 [Neocallimastix sp. JGI-2020a]